MSDNLISQEEGNNPVINLKIIDNNKRVDVELNNSFESTLLSHNLDSKSHPGLLNSLTQITIQTNQQIANLLTIVQGLSDKDRDLDNKISQNKSGDSSIQFSVAAPTLPNHAANKDYVDLKAGKSSNVITGLGLSYSPSSVMVVPGYCLDSNFSKLMTLNSALSKTLIVFAAGNGNGGLDVSGTVISKTFYVYLISNANSQCDILFSLSSFAPTLPSGFIYFRNIGYFVTDSSGVPSFAFPSQDLQSTYVQNLLLNVDLSNTTIAGKNTITGYCMPDYTKGITFSSNTNYTVPSNGVIVSYTASAYSGETREVLTINGIEVSQGIASYGGNRCGLFGIVSKNDTAYVAVSNTTGRVNTFYPMKGAS